MTYVELRQELISSCSLNDRLEHLPNLVISHGQMASDLVTITRYGLRVTTRRTTARKTSKGEQELAAVRQIEEIVRDGLTALQREKRKEGRAQVKSLLAAVAPDLEPAELDGFSDALFAITESATKISVDEIAEGRILSTIERDRRARESEEALRKIKPGDSVFWKTHSDLGVAARNNNIISAYMADARSSFLTRGISFPDPVDYIKICGVE